MKFPDRYGTAGASVSACQSQPHNTNMIPEDGSAGTITSKGRAFCS
jgi:hypothetical protein